MQITDQQLNRFIEIYQKHFGVSLDRETAHKKGMKLAEVTQLLLKENYEKHTAKI